MERKKKKKNSLPQSTVITSCVRQASHSTLQRYREQPISRHHHRPGIVWLSSSKLTIHQTSFLLVARELLSSWSNRNLLLSPTSLRFQSPRMWKAAVVWCKVMTGTSSRRKERKVKGYINILSSRWTLWRRSTLHRICQRLRSGREASACHRLKPRRTVIRVRRGVG